MAAAEYLGEDVVLVHPPPDKSEQALTATWDSTEQLLSVTPTDLLEAGKDYRYVVMPMRIS